MVSNDTAVLVAMFLVLGLFGCKDSGGGLTEPERRRINRQLEHDAHVDVENNPFMSRRDKSRIHGEIREDYDRWRRMDNASQE